MKNNFLSTLKFLIGWPLSLVALFFVGKIFLSQWNQIVPYLQNLNLIFVILSILSFLAYYFLRGLMWKILLEKQGHPLNFMETVYLWARSEIRRFIPGNIWAVVSRTHAFHGKQVKKTTTIMLIMYEAQFLVLGYFLISLLAIQVIANEFIPIGWNKQLFVLGGVLIIFIVTSIFILHKKIMPKVIKILPPFSALTNLRLLAFSCISSLFFGLGTYFCAIAIFPLRFWDPFILIGFFVLSILIGYLSFITPMGIGVREAAIAYILSRHISISSASFVSIFARIIVIISELLFLGICFLWVKTYRKS